MHTAGFSEGGRDNPAYSHFFTALVLDTLLQKSEESKNGAGGGGVYMCVSETHPKTHKYLH